jgi:hypothetical protein
MQAVQQLRSKKYKAAINSIQTAHRWPANLGVGKPYAADIDARLENYMEGICLEHTHSAQLAVSKWNAVIDDKRSTNNSNNLVTALALNKIDRKDEAEKVLSAWAAEQPESKIAQWCLDVYHGKEPVTKDLAGDENFRILQALLR